MSVRGAVLGAALLCALFSGALATPSASAKGTTAFTCVEGGNQDFVDPHCSEAVKAGAGEFSHSGIEEGEEVPTILTNEETGNETKEAVPAVLKGTMAGVPTQIECGTVEGTSVIESVKAGVDGSMASEGKNVKVSLTGCAVLKPKGCIVKEPIELTGTSTTRVGLGAEKDTMGVEFKPLEGQPLATITFQNKGEEKCPVINGGKPFNLEGTVMATGSRGSSEAVNSTSATLLFTNAMTKETLKIGTKAVEFESTVAVSVPETQGTTAFACIEGGGKNFADTHCAEEVGAGSGEFSHSGIEEGKETSAVLTNEKTQSETKAADPMVLKGIIGEVNVEIECAAVNGTFTLENVKAGIDGAKASEGKNVEIDLTNCAVLKPTKCIVAEPIELVGTSTTRVGLGAEKDTMGVEFKPLEGQPLATITFKNKGEEKCAYHEGAFKLTGTAIATGSRGPDQTVSSTSATLDFTAAMTAETLKFAGNTVELESSMTVRKGPKEGKITFQTGPTVGATTLTTTES